MKRIPRHRYNDEEDLKRIEEAEKALKHYLNYSAYQPYPIRIQQPQFGTYYYVADTTNYIHLERREW